MNFKKIEIIYLTSIFFIFFLISSSFEFVRDDILFFKEATKEFKINTVQEAFSQHYFSELNTQAKYYRPLAKIIYHLENVFFKGNSKLYQCANIFMYCLFALSLCKLLLLFAIPLHLRLLIVTVLSLHPLAQISWLYKSSIIDSIVNMSTVVCVLMVLKSKEPHQKYLLATIFLMVFCFFIKESALLIFPITTAILLFQKRLRVSVIVMLSTMFCLMLYFYLRSQITVLPKVLSQSSIWPELVMAWLRESFWTPLFTLFLPSQTHLENLVPIDMVNGNYFLMIAILFWLTVIYLIWKFKFKEGYLCLAVFWLYWLLVLPNVRYLFEKQSYYLYLPGHLMMFPMMSVYLLMAFIRWKKHVFRSLLFILALWTMYCGLQNISNYRNQESLFRSYVDKQPPHVQPYQVLASLLIDKGELEEAVEVLNTIERQQVLDSEIYYLLGLANHKLGRDDAQYFYRGAEIALMEMNRVLPHLLKNKQRNQAIEYIKNLTIKFPHEKEFKNTLIKLKQVPN